MRLLGIQILKKEPSISKILSEEWYPFGCYNVPKENTGVVLPERGVLKDTVYQYAGLPYITVNCIVGMNGAGKSSLLDIMYRIVNNFTFKLLGEDRVNNQHGRNLVYAYGVYAKLFYEIDGNQYCIQCEDEIVTFYCKRKGQGCLQKISFDGIENPKDVLTDFFYTISTNYSIYSLNEYDYKAQNENDIKKGINGKWLQGLFHKNDGYLTPIVITPFRHEGSIDVPRENNLAKQRIVALSLLSEAQDTNFFDGYTPAELIFEIDMNYQTRIRDGYMIEIDKKYPGLTSSLLIEAFSEAWDGYLQGKYEMVLGEEYIDQYNTALFYLGYKTLKICMTYDDFWKVFDVTNLIKDSAPRKGEKTVDVANRFIQYVRDKVPERAKKVIKKIEHEIEKSEKSHVTLKIEVCLDYIIAIIKENELLWPNKGRYPVETVVSGKILKTYNDAVMILPPPFFNYDIKFVRNSDKRPIDSSWGKFNESKDFTLSQMSSGERQMLNMVSYVLYHIKNIQSIRDDDYRVNYHHICLVFDEAELYFHPDYQRKFMSMLLESLQWCHIDTNMIRSIQILVVTHSPFVLSDMFRDNMLYLRDGDCADMPQNEIFGANLYQLMTESFFFDESAMGRVASKQIAKWIKRVNECGDIGDDVIELIGDPLIRNYIKRKRAENRRNYV